MPEPHASHYGVVPIAPPEDGIILAAIGRRHERAIEAMARVDTLATSTRNPFFFSRLLSRQEAVSSSSIEGTQSTLDELLSIEETGDEEAGHEARQVRDYALLLGSHVERARHEGPAIFTLPLVQSLHRQVMQGDPSYRDVPGELRRSVVWIGVGDILRSTWTPPPPDDVEACLEQCLDYMRNEGMQQMTQSLATRMAVAHAHFEAVHPFRDGNGRVGRILLPLAMAADGRVPLYLSRYIESRRNRYYAALKAAQQQLDWAAIIGFFCDAIVETVAHLEQTIALMTSLREDWARRRAFRKSSSALRALDVLLDYPVMTAKRLAAELGVGFGTASDALALLQQIGIVTERTGYRRNRLFVATEALSIVNRPFDEE